LRFVDVRFAFRIASPRPAAVTSLLNIHDCMTEACCGGTGGVVDQGGSRRSFGLGNEITSEGTGMGDYLGRWNNVWQKYADFAKTFQQQRTHPCHHITRVVNQQDFLVSNLTFFDEYDSRVETFRSLARRAKARPADTGLKTQLDGLQQELTNKKKLAEYSSAGRETLKSLEEIAAVDNRLSLGPSEGYERVLIKNLFIEVKSMSNDLLKDIGDYVNKEGTLATIRMTVHPSA
jgi:hypothetical protein